MYDICVRVIKLVFVSTILHLYFEKCSGRHGIKCSGRHGIKCSGRHGIKCSGRHGIKCSGRHGIIVCFSFY
jgi:hypothetical protein